MIKAIITDVDGCLTDNKTYIDERTRAHIAGFSLYDLAEVQRLRESNIQTVFVSGSDNWATQEFAKKCGVQFVYHPGRKIEGVTKIGEALHASGLDISWGSVLSFISQHCIVIGNDTNDLALMHQAALSGCPRDAHPRVLSQVAGMNGVISKRNGGDGVLMDVVYFAAKHLALSV